MIVLGIILSIIGILLIVSFVSSRVKCTTKVEATVTKLKVKTFSVRGRTVKQYTPVVTYTVDGKEYTKETLVQTRNPDKYTVGEKLSIYTDLNDPKNMRFGSEIGFLVAGIVFASAGIFFLFADQIIDLFYRIFA